MTRLERVLELLDNYDLFASVCVESYVIPDGAAFLKGLRQEKEKLTKELVEHGCRRSIDTISQDIFSEKPKMTKETWSGGGFGL